MEKMRKLFEKVAANQYLQAKFAAIINEAEEARNATRKKLLDFAKDAGYEVTAEEMQEYFRSLMVKQEDSPEGSLTDMELDMVAGGKSAKESSTLVSYLFGSGAFCEIVSLAPARYQKCKPAE